MDNGRDAHGIRSLNRHALEQIVAASPAAMLVVDANHPELAVVYANPAYERLTGFALAELAGRPWPARGRAANDAAAAPLLARIGRGETCRGTIDDVRRDGSALRCDVSVTPLRSQHGDVRFHLLCYEPVPEAARQGAAHGAAAESLVESSGLHRMLGTGRHKFAMLERIDPATGLVRFAYFQETLRRDLSIAQRERRFVTLLVFEIVEFDVYRQTFGDKAAESCQRMIGAQIVRALRRAGDLCARYGDGTLVAAVIGQHESDVGPLVDQIAANVRQLRLHNPRGKSSRYIETRVTVIGCPPGAHDDPEQLIARSLAGSRGGSDRFAAHAAMN
jgi:diguanylate cyclase (GGDEF)-like protein/PAS domain S-box-containing protein